MHVGIAEKESEVTSVAEQVRTPAAGAVVTFLGAVRETSRGRRVVALEYEAYPEMALRVLRGIAQEALQRWELGDVAIVHRIGRLRPGEASVGIAVAAGHRGPAFEACRFIIERIKAAAPIWKKEIYQAGEAWVEGVQVAPAADGDAGPGPP
jgi:molybdopterin synthase catalytic subunit